MVTIELESRQQKWGLDGVGRENGGSGTNAQKSSTADHPKTEGQGTNAMGAMGFSYFSSNGHKTRWGMGISFSSILDHPKYQMFFRLSDGWRNSWRDLE